MPVFKHDKYNFLIFFGSDLLCDKIIRLEIRMRDENLVSCYTQKLYAHQKKIGNLLSYRALCFNNPIKIGLPIRFTLLSIYVVHI